MEILNEINNGSPTTSSKIYEHLTNNLGTEFDILMKIDYQEIEKKGNPLLKEAIRKVRNREVFVDPGFDGVFGKVKIFKENNEKGTSNQQQPTLF